MTKNRKGKQIIWYVYFQIVEKSKMLKVTVSKLELMKQYIEKQFIVPNLKLQQLFINKEDFSAHMIFQQNISRNNLRII